MKKKEKEIEKSGGITDLRFHKLEGGGFMGASGGKLFITSGKVKGIKRGKFARISVGK